MKLVHPLEDFGPLLNTVQAPSRYIGGEYGAIIKPHAAGEQMYNAVVAFPDLYEIGMSNLAIKIIYNALNALPGVRCERVFAPDVDFEHLLRTTKIPLYSLETGMPLSAVDFLGFSIGYELGATEVLAMLDTGGIPLLAKERSEGCPIVIAGGCGMTNPAPFADFFDAVMIGEAEGGLFTLVEELAAMKRQGAGRAEMLAYVASKPFIWTKDCGHIARRAVQGSFGLEPSVPAWFPQPNAKPVQDHGVVEIMRGCPNGCRFCHAGVYYRPTRVKSLPLIIEEIDHLVFDAGYREISLNSLSSADFPDIEGLLDILTERYKGYNVSFQLPSLKVNSMSLPLLEKLSTVRKSGLTFAVETPEEAWQLSLNKEVYAQHLEAVIREAKAKGWSTAKFYFMVGLPVGDYFGEEGNPGGKSEEETIVDFLLELQKRTHIQCNVNVGVFIPKAHTAYQWVKQLTPEEAARKMDYIYRHLPRGKFKLGRHNYDMTVLEGLLSRGDSRAGQVILGAYRKGARLDAWDEHLAQNMQYWNAAFDEAGWDVKGWIYRDWNLDETLPWDGVSLGPAKAFYQREWQRSLDHLLTQRCMSNCDHPCGICNSKEKVSVHSEQELEKVSASLQNKTIPLPPERPESNIPVLYRVLFNFTRMDGGEYTAYLAQVEMFRKAILRSNLPFVFTVGFNPLPRLEFATAMSLGIPSHEETATCYLYDPCTPEEFIAAMNRVLPPFFHLTEALVFPVTNLRKRETLSQGLWGCQYRYTFAEGVDSNAFFAVPETRTLFEDSNGCRIAPVSDTAGNSLLSLESTRDFLKLPSKPRSFLLEAPASDKKFRTALETVSGKKWYELAQVEKLHTIARADVSGWTAADEENWRYKNATFQRSSAASDSSSDSRVLFMDLYRTIAAINLELINKKAELEAERKNFYARHPDLREKHLKRNPSLTNDV